MVLVVAEQQCSQNAQGSYFLPYNMPASLFNQTGRGKSDVRRLFAFDTEVKPGWIEYNPQKITVLSCNDSFRSLGQVNTIVDVKKQMISVRNEADLHEFSDILEKPALMCVTRRHHCPNSKTLCSESEKSLLSLNPDQRERRSMSGFEIDFTVIFPPGVLRKKIGENLKKIKKKIAERKRYCFRVDVGEMMQELTPTELQDLGSLEFVSWHNTALWLTYHCKPHHSLMYVNGFLFWAVLFPFALFVALPYRLGRRIFCQDSRVDLKTPMKFTAEAKDLVAVNMWFAESPPPGANKKHAKHFSVRATTVAELKPFVQDCNIVSFGFEES